MSDLDVKLLLKAKEKLDSINSPHTKNVFFPCNECGHLFGEYGGALTKDGPKCAECLMASTRKEDK